MFPSQICRWAELKHWRLHSITRSPQDYGSRGHFTCSCPSCILHLTNFYEGTKPQTHWLLQFSPMTLRLHYMTSRKIPVQPFHWKQQTPKHTKSSMSKKKQSQTNTTLSIILPKKNLNSHNWQASCATSSLPVGFGGVSCNGSSSAKTVTITQLPSNHHSTSSCSHMFEIADRNGFKTKTLPSIFYFNVLIFLLFPMSLGPVVTANFENDKK